MFVLVELYDVVQGPALRTVRLSCPVAQGYDCHDRLTFGDVEERAESVGVAHSHDERVEAHGTGLQNQIAVAQAIVVGTPSIAHFIRLVSLEKARLAPLER